ncbi:MAG: hypothetical protein BGP16_03765 [Sphingobium sp. 66-54]|nr:MAG: hypothetical protein BGP16_03765 [Sphingobium sp. 66-54]
MLAIGGGAFGCVQLATNISGNATSDTASAERPEVQGMRTTITSSQSFEPGAAAPVISCLRSMN